MTTLERTDTLHVAHAPVLPGLSFRRFRSEADYPGMAAVLQAANAADGTDEFISAEELAADYERLANFDPQHDLLLAEANGAIVAYSRVNWWGEDDGSRIYSLIGEVYPAWRRKGIGRAMFRQAERRAQEIAAAHPADAPRQLQSYAYDTQLGARALLEQAGYQAVRHSFIMVRPNLDDLPNGLALPAGLEVRPARPEHFRAVWEAKEEAFRDHWGHRAASEEKYQEWLSDPFFDPDWWQVAWEGEVPVGMVLTLVFPEENERLQRRRGYTESIAVRRPWRKRGLARALLVRSLALLKERGFTEAALHVDSENPSGALRLYESVGFRAVQRESVYRKSLS
ncbi:MAG: GNAT family N-acetyltransferase [Anaerolineales bacterium]